MTLSLAAEAAMRTVGGDDAETVAMMGSATRKLEEVAVMEAEAAGWTMMRRLRRRQAATAKEATGEWQRQ